MLPFNPVCTSVFIPSPKLPSVPTDPTQLQFSRLGLSVMIPRPAFSKNMTPNSKTQDPLSLLHTHWPPKLYLSSYESNKIIPTCCSNSDASMSKSRYGSGPELEKFPDAPPTIAITTADGASETPDAGLRSLDHCE